jgi:hypothetical protein
MHVVACTLRSGTSHKKCPQFANTLWMPWYVTYIFSLLQQLKNFLHPRCVPCGKEFPTRVEWDHHKLTPLHLRVCILPHLTLSGWTWTYYQHSRHSFMFGCWHNFVVFLYVCDQMLVIYCSFVFVLYETCYYLRLGTFYHCIHFLILETHMSLVSLMW